MFEHTMEMNKKVRLSYNISWDLQIVDKNTTAGRVSDQQRTTHNNKKIIHSKYINSMALFWVQFSVFLHSLFLFSFRLRIIE